ncbi:MAG: glycosyltransferase [Deltaproteobacteria bacterium]|nr:glycosyltransferase [Deltaproteobacteria bacterium]
MICYYYPPIQAVGANRSIGFSRELSNLGWDVTVLSVRDCKDPWTPGRGGVVPQGVNVVRSTEWNLSRITDFLHGVTSRIARIFGRTLKRNYFREVLALPDTQVTWVTLVPILKAAAKADVVYVSCSPYSPALTALKAKSFSKKPLVVDFRDAWSLNPHITDTPFRSRIIRRMEQRVVNGCDRLILNSPGALDLYESAYPEHRSKFLCIPNGYDTINPASTSITTPFTIVHVGSFYGTRSPRLLLEALAELNNPDIEFVQVGGALPDYEEFESRVRIRRIPSVSQAEALELMKNASVLYLKQGFEPGVTRYIAVAAKTYEYLSTGLPILAEVPPGDNADLIRKYAQHHWIVDTPDREALKRAVSAAFDARSQFRPAVDPAFISDFSRGALARKLSETLESAIKAQ